MARGRTMEATVAEMAAPTPEELAIAEARARDDAIWDDDAPEDSGELSMTEEEYQALREANDRVTPDEMRQEAAARSRMGLGGSLGDDEPAPLRVATYDANGEAIDVEVERSARSAEADAVMDKPEPHEAKPAASKNDIPTIGQILMPGFPPQQAVHEVAVNISGRIILNISNPSGRAFWERLGLGERVSLDVDGVVVDRGGHLSLDSDLEDKKRLAKASVKVVGLSGVDEDDQPRRLSSRLTQDDIDWAHAFLESDALDTDEVRDFIERIASLGEPTPKDEDDDEPEEMEIGPDAVVHPVSGEATEADPDAEDEGAEPSPSVLDQAIALAGDLDEEPEAGE